MSVGPEHVAASEVYGTRAVRDRAAELIERRGWARLVRQEYGGPDVCRLGIVHALWRADEELNGWLAAHRRQRVSEDAITEILKETGARDLHAWNSRPSRTKDQVLAALRGDQPDRASQPITLAEVAAS